MGGTIIRTDGRSIRAQEVPEAERAVIEARRPLLEAMLVAARAFAEVEANVHYIFEGSATILQFGRRRGYGGQEVRMLTDLGRALRADPSLEAQVRQGTILPEAAGALARILENPSLQKEGDDWLEWAATDTTRDLRRRVRERIEEARQQETVVELRLHVTASSREDFGRARVIASRKEKASLTEGQTFTRVVGHYLDTFDEQRRQPGKRRLGPTSEQPLSRAVPAEVKRAIRARARDRCEAKGCENGTFLQFCHIRTPHAKGSGREEGDLALLCSKHHTMLDAGWIELDLPGVKGGRGPPG